MSVSNRFFPSTMMNPSFPTHPAPHEGRFAPLTVGLDDVSSKALRFISHRAASPNCILARWTPDMNENRRGLFELSDNSPFSLDAIYSVPFSRGI